MRAIERSILSRSRCDVVPASDSINSKGDIQAREKPVSVLGSAQYAAGMRGNSYKLPGARANDRRNYRTIRRLLPAVRARYWLEHASLNGRLGTVGIGCVKERAVGGPPDIQGRKVPRQRLVGPRNHEGAAAENQVPIDPGRLARIGVGQQGRVLRQVKGDRTGFPVRSEHHP